MASTGDLIRHDSVVSAGVTIAYSWCHSRRRTLGITVRPDKSVSVRVPLRTSLGAIRDFVTHRAAWILKIWNRQDARPPRQLQEYGRGALFMFQGEAFRLEFSRGIKSSVLLHDGLLLLTVAEIPAEATVRTMIDRWYRKQALEIIKERSVQCHGMMQNENIPLPPITIRTMKSRWGSYSYRTRRISINLNLIRMPPACLDYVLIHELCHIKIRHHGPDFWRMVSRYVPDHMALRKQMKHSA